MKEIKTFNSLLNQVRKNLIEWDSLELVEEHTCCELVDGDMLKAIEKFALDYVNLTHKDCDILWNKRYGVYSYCNNKDDVKIQLVIDALDYNLIGEKMTLTQAKKKAIELSK